MNKFGFDLQKYLKELEYLVNIDSGSRNPEGVEKIAQFFEEKYRAMNWNVVKYDFNAEVGPCLEVKNHDEEKSDVLLIGHMDTVFPNGTAAQRPFMIKGDRAHGPGVNDMKSGLLLMYYALRSIYEEKLDRDILITVILNSDEEIGSKWSREIIEKKAKNSKVAYVLEPARENGALVLERKGLAAYDLEFYGIAAHAGVEPEKGASAIVELGRFILELNQLNNYEIGTTVNVGVVSGGTARNVVAERSSAMVDLRFKQEEEKLKVDKALEDLKNNPIVKGVEVKVNELGMRPPMNLTEKTKKLWDIIEEIGKELKIDLKWVATGGGSDANFTAALDIPSIDGLGPVGGGSHGTSEYLEINSIEHRYELLKRLIVDERILRLLKMTS